MELKKQPEVPSTKDDAHYGETVKASYPRGFQPTRRRENTDCRDLKKGGEETECTESRLNEKGVREERMPQLRTKSGANQERGAFLPEEM